MQRSVATCHRCGFRIVFRHGDWMHADVAEDGFLTYRCLCAKPLGDHPELGSSLDRSSQTPQRGQIMHPLRPEQAEGSPPNFLLPVKSRFE